MPCVFPVLSLKLLDLVKGAKSSANLMGHGAAFTGGVLATMLALSGLLLALRGAFRNPDRASGRRGIAWLGLSASVRLGGGRTHSALHRDYL